MADEIDRKIIPGFLQDTFAVSCGAAYRGIEAMRSPAESLPKIASEMKTMFTPPADSRKNVSEMLRGLTGVWMDKGMTMFADCKTVGEKFTEGK